MMTLYMLNAFGSFGAVVWTLLGKFGGGLGEFLWRVSKFCVWHLGRFQGSFREVFGRKN